MVYQFVDKNFRTELFIYLISSNFFFSYRYPLSPAHHLLFFPTYIFRSLSSYSLLISTTFILTFHYLFNCFFFSVHKPFEIKPITASKIKNKPDVKYSSCILLDLRLRDTQGESPSSNYLDFHHHHLQSCKLFIVFPQESRRIQNRQ